MKWIRNAITILALVILMSVTVSAQPELPDPGITPDSPFYFIEKVFDIFRSNEVVMDRRASEIVAMAQKGHESGLAKALEGYEKALEKRKKEAEKNENTAEEVARQSSHHLAILARVREQVSEQSKIGIDKALSKSAKSRENALVTLEQQNQERSSIVAQATLQEVITNTPAEAQKGLQKALEAVQRKGQPAEIQTTERIAKGIETRETPEQKETQARTISEEKETGKPTEERNAKEESDFKGSNYRETPTTGAPSGTPKGRP